MIEDEDGAPLPEELQRHSPLWLYAYNVARDFGHDVTESVLRADKAMIAIAPILWKEQ